MSSKFDTEAKQKFCECISRGVNITQASKACGITRSTFYAHLKSDPEFKQMFEDAEESATDHVESALYQKAIEGDVKAQQVWLFNRRRERWADSKNIRLDADVKHSSLEFVLKWSDQHQK
jgi:AcrR family transcriptional regulator